MQSILINKKLNDKPVKTKIKRLKTGRRELAKTAGKNHFISPNTFKEDVALLEM